MTQEELKKRISQVEGFIRALTQQCHMLDERRHILVPLLQDVHIQQALKKKLDRTAGVGAWNHLAPLLGQDLLRDQARLFLDEGRRSGSLINLWRKIQVDPAIKDHFREAYGHMLDKLHVDVVGDGFDEVRGLALDKFRKNDAQRNFARFDSGWAQVEVKMADLKGDPVAEKIKIFRDKHHAHFEMKSLDEKPEPFDVGSMGLTFDEVLGFSDRCQAIVAELGLLLTQTSWDPKDFGAAHAKQGRAMWAALAS
ncbi:hypothetical protein [Lysobacter capsici]|uniref:AbiU2 domain-containing protein n=1 Tax=Lysobacter capsici TaxID=435897 RepID=UPI000BBB2530|nr:hypothetical protein [Lysobacter capsici]ATE70789.1 hypothetical protein CNO08_05070 [Lysobacter capsici]